MKPKRRKKDSTTTKYFDYTLLFIIIFLLGFGLIILYSVSSYESQSNFGNSFYYLKRQLMFIVMGFVGMTIVSYIPYNFWKKTSWLWYIIAFLLCTAVIFLGDEAGGQARWIEIAGIRFQPSELAKVGVIMFMATLLTKTHKQLTTMKNTIKVFLFVIPIILVIFYNNLSTALIVAGIAFFMVFVASPKSKHLIVLFLAAVAGVLIFTLFQDNYRAGRIDAWLHPEDFPDTAYQTTQSLYAIGSGGLFGRGLGSSMQKLGYVPEAQNDMIFSIICEELGLFGGICVIVLFVLMIWRFMVIANNAADLYGSFLVIGIMIHISLQVVLNIAVVTNTIPNTGVTLPFISYGGTAVFILLIEMGLALSVSRGIKLEDTSVTEQQNG
ncbi:MAG: putative lipid II flippase FtsW [Eubacterium sp.]|nr:putative lipid II flippase FtsW [Eubacterium sp.]